MITNFAPRYVFENHSTLLVYEVSYHYSKLYLVTYWNDYKVLSSQGEIHSKGPRPKLTFKHK